MTEQTEGADVVRPLTDEQRRYLWDGIEAAGVAGLVDTLVRTEVAAAEVRGAQAVLAAVEARRSSDGLGMLAAARAAAAAAGGGA